MTDGQWEDLLRIIGGELLDPLPLPELDELGLQLKPPSAKKG